MSAFVESWAATLHFGAAVVVFVSLLLSLLRIFRGPTPAERMMAAQLMGTAGVAALLLMESGLGRSGLVVPGAVDVVLVFSVLAGVAGVAFVRRGWERSGAAGGGEEEEECAHGVGD